MIRSALATLFALTVFAAGTLAHPRPELPHVLHWGPSAAAQGQGLDVLSYDLALTVDLQSQELRGSCAVEFMVTEDGLEDVLLHLAVLQADSVTYRGESLPYVHQGEEVRIDLPYGLVSGSIETLSVAYHGHPGHEAWGGFFFTTNVAYSVGVGLYTMPPSMARYWYPCYDDPADKALFDLRITVPAGKTVACGGTLQSVQPDSTGQWWIYHWKEDKPCAPYLASVHVSSYAVISDSIQGLRYRYYVYPEDSLDALRAFAKVPQMEAVYERLFGSYPFSKVAYAETPLS
jgi:aminopeptidase N